VGPQGGVSPLRNLAATVFGRNLNPKPSPRNLPPEYNMVMHSGAPYNADIPSLVPPPWARAKSPRGPEGLLPPSSKPNPNSPRGFRGLLSPSSKSASKIPSQVVHLAGLKKTTVFVLPKQTPGSIYRYGIPYVDCSVLSRRSVVPICCLSRYHRCSLSK
jgi:hypothetical protein